MAQPKPENSFEIRVKIQELDIETRDITYFYVYRTAIVKHGSFASMTIPLNLTTEALPLENLTQKSKTPTLELEIWLTDPSQPTTNRNYKSIKKIIQKKYYIISCIPGSRDPNSQTISTNLILINPIFLKMNRANGFNRIQESQTAYDVLLEYEDYLKGHYGDTAFEFKKIGDGINLNDYVYEQLMCRVENDFKIPDYLLLKKKAFNSYTYYFFDDFRITDDKEADICGMLINLIDKEQFNQIDAHTDKYIDIQDMSIKKVKSCFNPLSPIMQSNSRVITKDKDTLKERNADPGPTRTEQIKSSVSEEDVHEDRKIKTGIPELSFLDKDVADILNLYAPDSKEKANERYKIVQEQATDILRAFCTWEGHKCYPDVFQFDRRYNFSKDAKTELIHMPISIINIFRKENPNETKMFHGVRLQTIKFKPNDDDF
jgi:hypothetical protein